MAGDWLQKLVDDGVISADQLAEAVAMASAQGIKPEDALVKLEYVDEGQIGGARASQFGYDTVDLESLDISHEIVSLVSESIAREHTVIPIRRDGDGVVIAINDPMNYEVLDKLRFILNCEIIPTVATKDSIVAAINRAYGSTGGEQQSVDQMLISFTETAIDFAEEGSAELVDAEDQDAPIIKLVNLIITEAVNMRASDIHIEPFEDRIRLRYRIDGVLVERDSPPRRLLGALVSRIKIMGRIDITEKRRPQDGRVKTRINSKDYDLRVSILPTAYGQAVVMRILDRDSIKIGLENVGFSGENYRLFQTIIRRPNGIFLVTGPTGSGKTTTLYSAMNELNRPDRKIITAEDPVEYMLPGINQVEVRASIGLTFASIIRAMLRQAPNVILVGEIRDVETAEMAIQASLTGHLVFSTLHTNDAPSSITRLTDMGVQSFLVASTVMAIMAQRLVRRVCSQCGEPVKANPSELQHFEVTAERAAQGTFRKGRGCKQCQKSGYRGRVAVFELMRMNATLREMTFRNEPTQNLRRQARLLGMRTLVDDAVDKVLEGVTTFPEVAKLQKGGH